MGSVPKTTAQYSYLAGSIGSHLIENTLQLTELKGIPFLFLFPSCSGQKLLKVLKYKHLEIK